MTASKLALALFLVTPISAQVDWLNSAKTSQPRDFAMAEDSLRGRVVAFGGINNKGAPVSDTRTWDGAIWKKAGGSQPPARFAHAMAYDVGRDKIVLYGGTTGSPIFTDTWEWNGTKWSQLQPVNSPNALTDPAMAYDSVSGKILLFGGANGRRGPNSETWSFDGLDWSQLKPGTSPSRRHMHAMATDSHRRVVVLFGGTDGNTDLDDTWEWNGSTWTQIMPALRPLGRTGHAMAFDSRRGRMVVFGGYGNGNLNDTWEWDGQAWLQRQPVATPGAHDRHAMAFDSWRGVTVMAGVPSAGGLGGTWLLYNLRPASFSVIGQGCAGTVGVPKLSVPASSGAWLGETLTLSMEGMPVSSSWSLIVGLSNQSYIGGSLPADFSVLGMTGCSLFVSTEFASALAASGATGQLGLPIPNSTSLLGKDLFAQGFVVDPGANVLGAVFSNAGAATIGAK